jgi:hypothetical protein
MIIRAANKLSLFFHISSLWDSKESRSLMASSDAAGSIMDALDDLLNDLNAVTRELGFDTSPSEPASSTSLTSEKSSVSAESGLGLSNDLSSDFQPSKKVSPPKLPKEESPSQKSDYSEVRKPSLTQSPYERQ